MPRSEALHIGPYWAATPAGFGVVSSSVPPAAVIAAGTPLVAAPSEVATGAGVFLSLPVLPVVEPVLQPARSAAAATAAVATVVLRRAFMQTVLRSGSLGRRPVSGARP